MKAVFVVLIEKPDTLPPPRGNTSLRSRPEGVFLGYFKGAEESMGPKRHV
jgi:hypothetical protein